ncbi:multisubstrate pseudouridine synthase 7 [Populus alba x Populus x berolinensis]|nr:multisubstrate pseudouridine synthase 7 [Populus alba x Populus x berolinensis]
METSKATEESDVGILCYISQLPGFRGILKQRYADFIVNEVDTDGNVVHLTCLEPPPQMVEETKECAAKVSDEKMSESKSYEAEIGLFRSLAGDSDAEKLESLISQVDSCTGSEDSVPHIVLSPDSNKTHRTSVHNFFKQNFKFLVTDTTDGPDASSKCIRVRLDSGGHKNNGRNSKKRKERGEKPFDSRGSSNWPEHLGKFLRFHLYKENKDTQEALGIIGKMLGIQSKSFGFAGTKDKRAVSTQRVTVFKQQASRLAALNDRLIGIKVGDFCHVKEGLLLGKLLGNRFTVTLRGVIADSEDTIKAAADSLGRHGFINYFGLQRFGTGSVPTHLIGATLLRGEWKTAVSLILDPREGERDVIRMAREYYKESNDIEGTLRQLPRHLVAERAVLQCLKKCPGDYLQALKAIPRTLRMMYVHGYQSYLWNHAATERVQKYGFDQVVLGDLVYCKGDDSEKETVGVNSECNDDNCDDTYDCSHLDETSGTDLLERKNTLVKVVTVEDVSAGNYTVDDVVLPMPGSRVIFPTNEIVKVYHDLAKKDAINLTESVHSVKEFSITSMTGSYRRVFQKPLDFEWELLAYNDSNKPLAETDLDNISKTGSTNIIKQEEQGKGEDNDLSDCTKLPVSSRNSTALSTDTNEGSEREVESEQVSGSNWQETQMALKLSLTLPASCYATMAIRELLKTSTSVAYHKTLNQ